VGWLHFSVRARRAMGTAEVAVAAVEKVAATVSIVASYRFWRY
jgi:hypothetical protein